MATSARRRLRLNLSLNQVSVVCGQDHIALTESAWLHREQSRIDGGYYETMVPFLCYVVDNKTGREIWFKWKDSITEAFWLETMEKCGFEKAYVTTISSPKSAMKAMN